MSVVTAINNEIIATRNAVKALIQKKLITDPSLLTVSGSTELCNDDKCTIFISRDCSNELYVEVHIKNGYFTNIPYPLDEIQEVSQYRIDGLRMVDIYGPAEGMSKVSVDRLTPTLLYSEEILTHIIWNLELKTRKLLVNELKDHILIIDANNRVVESTREEAARLGIPSCNLINYIVYSSAENDGIFVAVHRKYGVTIDTNRIGSLKATAKVRKDEIGNLISVTI